MDAITANNSSVIQSLLQRADQLTNVTFGSNSKLTIVGQEQYSASNLSNLGGLKIENIDAAIANQAVRSIPTSKVSPYYQLVDANSPVNVARDLPTSALVSPSNYTGELFYDPNGPQIIRRPPVQSPVTYRQNVTVRFLQPPPVPPPGPLVIKEVRPIQPPAPPPLIIRQLAPPLPTPPPLVLRERPPQGPPQIPTQTFIKNLPAIPVPPRSVIIERYPPIPPRPRDIIIERWVPYSKEPQRRQVITHRAPPPRSYPPPRNTIIIYEPIQANVVRSVQKVGIQPQNPQEYIDRYGHTLLDPATLVAQAQQAGVIDHLSPPLSSHNYQYQTDHNVEYYLNNTQTVWVPEYEYNMTSWENQTATNNEQAEVYWTDPQEDTRVILQRLGLAVE